MYFSRIFIIAASCIAVSAGPLRANPILFKNITRSTSVSSDLSIEIIPLTSSVITESSGSVVLTISTLVPIALASSNQSSLASTVAASSISKSNSSSTAFPIPSITETLAIPSGTNTHISATVSPSLVSDTLTGGATITISFALDPSSSCQTTTRNVLQVPTVLTGAPTSKISASPSLLAQNLAQAQSYNSLFLTLNDSSPCTQNQVACLLVTDAALSNTTGIGICNAERKYVITPCPNSLSKEFGAVSSGCFAMPLQDAEGVEVECVDVGAAGAVLGPSATLPSSTMQSSITSTSITLKPSISTSISSSVAPPETFTSFITTTRSTETLNSIIKFSITNSPSPSSATSLITSTFAQSGASTFASITVQSTTEDSEPSATSSGGEIVITIVPVTFNSSPPVTVTETVTVTVHDK